MKQNNSTVPIVISRVFEPVVVLPAVALLGGMRAGLGERDLILYSAFLLVAVSVPVMLFLAWRRTKRTIPWDMPERQTRVQPLIAMSLLSVVYCGAVSLFHTAMLTRLFVLFAVWAIGFTAITARWKISGHTGIIALTTGLIVFWLGGAWWPLLLLVPLVGWARITGKNHTVAEVVLGVGYSWVLLFIFGSP